MPTYSNMFEANQARLASYRRANKFIAGVRWLGTLDASCCTICAALDGLAWDLDGNPIDGNAIALQVPPIHDHCRCVLTPIAKGIDEIFGATGLDERMAPTTRASMDGPIDAVTFEAFLKRQSPEFANIVLGPERAELWRNGKLGLRDMIAEDANLRSMEELGKLIQARAK